MVKSILLIISILLNSQIIFSQCYSYESDVIDCGDTLSYSFFVENTTEDFNLGISTWASNSGAIYTNPYLASPTNDTYFWMGPSATVPTALTSTPIDVSSGGQICFDFVYAVQGQPSPAEGPDLYDEGISLQYNNGGVWNDIVYYAPNGDTLPANPGISGPVSNPAGPSFTNWTSVCLDIPLGAISDTTSFRWIQTVHSSANNDHWGLDNIVISTSLDTSYSIFLVDSINSYNLLGSLQQNIDSVFTEDTYLNFMITNNIDTCFADREVIIRSLDLGPDLILDCVQGGLEVEIDNVNLGSNFSWSPNNYISNSNSLNPFLDPLNDTEYVLTTQCGIDTLNINVLNNFIFDVSDDTAICLGDSLNIEVFGGGQTFTWSPNDNSLDNLNISNPIATPVVSTTYTVTADSAGCSKSKDIEVQVSNLQFAFFLVTDANCLNSSNGSIVAPAIGGVDTIYYSLFDGVNTIVTGQPVFENLADGNYTIAAYDALNCHFVDSSFTINGGPAIVDSVITTSTFSCNSTGLSTIELITSNSTNATYSINNGPHSSSNLFSGLTDGTYFIEIINDFCTSTESVLVSNPSVNLFYNSIIQVSCYNGANGQVLLGVNNGDGPFQYSLDNINFQDTALFDSLSVGLQTFYVMDSNGCSDSLTLNINQGSELSLGNISVDNTLCNGETGIISFNGLGGQSPYMFSIDSGSNFSTINSFNNIEAGSYQLQITDALNCLSDTLDFTIQENTAIIIDTVSHTNIYCNGSQNGSIYFNANGGQAPYMFSIDSGATFLNTNQFSNLNSGNYTLICTDNYGCFSDTSFITITETPPLFFNTVNITNPNCSIQDGVIDISTTGGSSLYQYSLNNGLSQSNGSFNTLGSGTYLFSVIDSAGCTKDTTIHLSNINAPVLDITNIDSISCYGLNDGSIELSVTNTHSSLIFSVNNSLSQTDSVFENLASGMYDFKVEDSLGCESFVSVYLSQPDSLILKLTSTIDSNSINSGTASVLVSGGVPGYSYLWSDSLSQITATANGLLGGDYSVLVTDNNLCTKNAVINVGIFNVIKEIKFEEWSIYPNPNTGVFTLEFLSKTNTEYTLSIVNLVGKEVYIKNIEKQNGLVKENITLKELSKSIYYLIVTDGINRKIEKVVVF